MPDDLGWTPDETGLDDEDFPPLDLGEGATPCPHCGEDACARSCTGAILADDAGEEEA